MFEQQLDLFSDRDVGIVQGPVASPRIPLRVSEMDDAALIAAIPDSSFAESSVLAAEAGRRRLTAAVAALATLCRRFTGFGAWRAVPEQVAAIEGLAMIGDRAAAHAVAEMIERAGVQGPTLEIAVGAAVSLRSPLSSDALQKLLRHDEPAVRADACRCARPWPEVISILIDLLGDLDRKV